MRTDSPARLPPPGTPALPTIPRTYLLPTNGHWAILLAILFITDATDRSNAVRVWHWSRVVAPLLEAHYGFTVVPHPNPHVLRVASVVDGGLFQQSGVRPGWSSAVSSCFGAGQYELLFAELRRAKHQRVSVGLPFVDGDLCRDGPLRWVVVPQTSVVLPPAA